ncbi:MAG TPA: class I SAM-dependent methyltransferase [Stellaceae bacterium]|nr:class I SAM-dependent methyltransferase [Stellaceae bacterium]
MERAEYERLAALDRRLWWFQGLHAEIAGALVRHGDWRADQRLLDAGCGTGGLLVSLRDRMPAMPLFGLELDRIAAQVAQSASGRPITGGSINQLPYRDASFAAIVSADVLCHKGVEETTALREFRRCLRPGGLLVLNLPAYPWMLGEHDLAVHNVRRYTARGVRALLMGTGFTQIVTSYWNTVLFPLMVLKRKVGWRREGKPSSDVVLMPAPVERLFSAIVAAEAALVRAGLRLPFGGSVLATAMKP